MPLKRACNRMAARQQDSFKSDNSIGMLLGEKNIRTHLKNAEWKKLMKNQIRIYISVVLVVVGMFCISNAQAELISQCGPYAFSWIWDDDANPANGIIGEQQLSFTVEEVTGGMVFRFENIGEQACSLTDIYFESSLETLKSIVDLDSSDGVSFSLGANPGNMPRWEKVDFEPTLEMTADSDSPAVSHNGINPDEWLEITVETQAGLEQVCQELNDQSIRIGIHVQAFEDGGSESFVTPEPASMSLLAFGGLILRKRRKV
jgi:hypothetical protein